VVSTAQEDLPRAKPTFLFRHDLQFMLSLGSFDIRLLAAVAGNRSMPTWGLDMIQFEDYECRRKSMYVTS
jgi:hypothetical protein